MDKCSSSFQRNIIVLIFFTLLFRSCWTGSSPSNIDLSTTTLDPSSTGFKLTGSTSQYLGYSVSTAGDIDNDGYDDFIVAAYEKNTVYVLYGGKTSSFSNLDLSTTSLNPLTIGFKITGKTTGDKKNHWLGYSVSTAGDIDNDGYDDIIVGDPWKDNVSDGNGEVYVIYGGPKSSMRNWDFNSGDTLNPLTTGFTIIGDLTEQQIGYSVSTAGDINNDGYDDIIFGAPGEHTAYVIYGGPKSAMSNWDFSSLAMLNPLTTGFTIQGVSGRECFACTVSTAGDIDNDGYAEIIVGAYSNSTAYVIYGGPKSSMAHLVPSSTPLDPFTTGFIIAGKSKSDSLGRSMGPAGDVDGDGYNDFIIGAKNKAYVFYGGPKSTMSNWDFRLSAALHPSPTGFMITGNGANDNLGGSVSRAGDINKDGYDDIIIGASWKNLYKGAAYVIYGGEKSSTTNIDLSSTTLEPLKTGFIITGSADDDSFGFSVRSAGDINNDGYDDIVVGARGYDNNKGAAYVIYGGTTHSCPKHCNQCSSESVCTECKTPYLLYQSKCVDSCPTTALQSGNKCQECPSYCSSCASPDSCQVCSQGFTLSNSVCVPSSQRAQGKATQAISSLARGISSIVCVGSTVAPLSALVSKTVQNTRYLNLTVTSDLSEIYKTWNTDLISWDIPNAFSKEDHFKTAPSIFAQYEAGSPFLVTFWPTLINIIIGFGTFFTCILLKNYFEHKK